MQTGQQSHYVMLHTKYAREAAGLGTSGRFRSLPRRRPSLSWNIWVPGWYHFPRKRAFASCEDSPWTGQEVTENSRQSCDSNPMQWGFSAQTFCRARLAFSSAIRLSALAAVPAPAEGQLGSITRDYGSMERTRLSIPNVSTNRVWLEDVPTEEENDGITLTYNFRQNTRKKFPRCSTTSLRAQ